jgi:hypothetical protein
MTQTDSGLGSAQSVKEVWINSCKKQVASKPANVTQLETIANGLEAGGLPFHPENPEGSMIKELLLKTRIINLAPVSTSTSPIRYHSLKNNQTGQNKSMFYIIVYRLLMINSSTNDFKYVECVMYFLFF